MSMSDCPKCWDTPCSCGWEFRNYSSRYLREYIAIFSTIIEYRERNPGCKFSSFTQKETVDDKNLMKAIRAAQGSVQNSPLEDSPTNNGIVPAENSQHNA